MMLSFGKEGEIFASGTVWARLVMPRGINVPVNATDIWPDVLVFDGEVPEEDVSDLDQTNLTEGAMHPAGIHIPTPPWLPDPLPHHPLPPVPPINFPSHHHGGDDEETDPPPLPDPVPERAFARIRPDSWLAAQTTPDSSSPDDGEEDGWVIISVDGGGEGSGWSATVTSKVRDVPLQVLPGRETQFRNFVSKVLLSKEGALAGVKGTSAVRAAIPGLLTGRDGEDGEDGSSSRLELRGLPFEGVVRIGKKGI